ncbi:virulence factor Mce family protein [Nocardia otitidiscaviarum]|uniref:Virulence factor Mce family protein n=1 Tax=Nocardia otitidiscaviarum TaxID=1823 RepID=A0A379JM87_9NOCA|nr:MlaD family protein [Nocardia otitidiscaviarum]SUD49113.1 virulence factor Mce family protein [Nocardia otitidiscaviarum]
MKLSLSGPMSLVLLLVLTLVCGSYMAVGVLNLDPRRDSYAVTVLVDTSGGLMKTSEVTLRGMPIGRVRSIEATSVGLAVRLEFDARYRIPVDSEVRVSNLSAAGEQFLDFRPTGTAAPYLRDGSIVPARQVRIATTVGDALAKLDALTAQIDPLKLERLATTVAAGFEGRDADVANLTRALTLTAGMLRDKRDAIARLYVNVQTLGDNFDGRAPTLSATAGDVTAALPELLHIIRSFQDFSYVGEHVFTDPIGPLVQRIDDYIALLGPDLGHIATVLKPATSSIKPVRVDAGSIIDLLATVFPGDGAAHVTVGPR